MKAKYTPGPEKPLWTWEVKNVNKCSEGSTCHCACGRREAKIKRLVLAARMVCTVANDPENPSAVHVEALKLESVLEEFKGEFE